MGYTDMSCVCVPHRLYNNLLSLWGTHTHDMSVNVGKAQSCFLRIHGMRLGVWEVVLYCPNSIYTAHTETEQFVKLRGFSVAVY